MIIMGTEHDHSYTSVARIASFSTRAGGTDSCVTSLVSLPSPDGLNTVPCKIEF